MPRVSGATKIEKGEQAKQKERKQIDNYIQLEQQVTEKVIEVFLIDVRSSPLIHATRLKQQTIRTTPYNSPRNY